MSKSIKLKNNNYWDSKGIVHNRNSLANIINYNVFNRVNLNVISDSQNVNLTIKLNSTYLFLNCHTYKRCLLLITTWVNGLKVDVIFKSEDLAVPNITMNGTTLTIIAPNQCRGYLYEIPNAPCA